ncbi:hypothetical protein OAG45_00890 [bacterium]|jgi:hypothetical protein|nr:hypothetical protein [bacterium]
MQSFESSIDDWIQNFLSKPSKTFNNLPPCPYAKKAWLDNSVLTHWLDGSFELDVWIRAEIENYTYHWPKGKEVVVLGFDYDRITANNLSKIIDDTKPMLDKRGYVALEDHPLDPEEVQGVKLNHGKYGLVLIQEKEKLNTARAWLEKKDYYKNWPQDYKTEVQER